MKPVSIPPRNQTSTAVTAMEMMVIFTTKISTVDEKISLRLFVIVFFMFFSLHRVGWIYPPHINNWDLTVGNPTLRDLYFKDTHF